MSPIGNRVRLSFAIGPVQGFVAQARRTKDFWAGSWLLSYLAECALVGAESVGGEVIIPYRAQPRMLTSLDSAVGGIPNKFEMRFDSSQTAREAAVRAESSFRHEWFAIARLVEDKYLNEIVEAGRGTRDIWKRQIENFWELSWVITDEADANQLAGAALAARKYFRDVPVTVEPGTKCSLMSDYQELSGWFGRGHWQKQAEFWSNFRAVLQRHSEGLDLGDDEKLCGLALIKRMLPNVIGGLPVSKDLVAGVGPERDREELIQQAKWPSLGFFAALPWLRRLEGDPLVQAKEFVNVAQTAASRGGDGRFWKSEQVPAKRFGVDWATVDATAWFKTGLVNNEGRLPNDKQNELLARLGRIYAESKYKPIPYYALLCMDGDSMGELLQTGIGSTELSSCLGEFSGQVERIVNRFQGRTVYAGGDDVMAFLAAEEALAAATELARCYQKCFASSPAAQHATLSGSLVFAQWRFPLSQVIRLSHELLDRVAKDATGRDALAIGIVQGSGLNGVWAAPWKVIRGEVDQTLAFSSLLDMFASKSVDRNDDRPGYSASYFYSLRNQYASLLPTANERPGTFQDFSTLVAEDGSQNVLSMLAHSELRRRMSSQQRIATPREVTLEQVNKLMSLAYRWQHVRQSDSSARQLKCSYNSLSFDGWRIARFIRQVQQGELPDHE